MPKRTTAHAIVWIVFLTPPARADVGVFAGTGRNLRQITTESVQLNSINVTIVLQRGGFLFDGAVDGLDSVEYICRFCLTNLSDQSFSIKVGFPIDSFLTQPPEDAKTDAFPWIAMYNFIARDDGNTYHVDFERTDVEDQTDRYTGIFTWTIDFTPREVKKLNVHYRLPMSMTLAGTSKRAFGEDPPKPSKSWMDHLSWSLLEFAAYTTETGSSWAGNVEKANFTVICKPFERYLTHRGLFDDTPPDESEDTKERTENAFPVHQVWWFRDISPDGWSPTQNGFQWEYKDFKPKDRLYIRYYLMQYPTMASEVKPWIDALLATVPDERKHKDELGLIRQILLATYGEAPKDPEVLTFVEDQVWYHPRKGFSLSMLNNDQRAVVTEFDRIVAKIDRPRK